MPLGARLLSDVKEVAVSSQGSVAPKERVNIVYRPATGDAQAEVELPLKLLVLGDYTLRDDDTPIEELKPINVDKDNFNDVLKGQNLSLSMSVPDKLDPKASEDARLAVNLNFQSINDFSPDAIVEKIPELSQMIALRESLKALKGPLGNIPDFRKQVQALVKDEGVRERLLNELGIQNK
jgi:type VI secretion system protein ImpB